VDIQVLPTRALLLGGVSLDDDWVRAEEEIFLAEGEHFVRYRPGARETAAGMLAALREQTHAAGLDLHIGLTAGGRLSVRHNKVGSQYKFKGASFKTPLLSKRPGKVEWSRKGRDIQGTLGGEQAFGIGRMLVGYLDNEHTSELSVLWEGGRLEEGRLARCCVTQNAIVFQDGAEQDDEPVRITLPAFYTAPLGRWLESPSGCRGLGEMRFATWEELRDALHLLMAVSFEAEEWRERVAGWVKRYQNQALATLRKGEPFRDAVPLDERVSAGQAERMARQLRRLIRATSAGELVQAK
jgi:hypothetical protein